MVNNHIIIGLGGTGGNVIKVFRQQIVDKYGEINNVDELNNIDFLYIDSQPNEFEEGKWIYQGQNIKLHGSSELILKAGVLNEKLQDHSSRSEFLGNDEEWGDLLKDKQLAKKAGNQMRRLGRVNLLSDISKIIDTIKIKEQKLSDNKKAKTLIHIVSGLAGGTGSGSVVDITARLLKTFEQRSGDISINLYLKLPETEIPNGWGGQYSTSFGTKSFYQVNGYAAIKEINGLASGFFEPIDIIKKAGKVSTTNIIQASYIFTERNNEGIGFSDIISPIASLLFLKTFTAGSNSKTTGLLNLSQILEDVDTAENRTIMPDSYYGLSPKFRVPGIFKIGVPKVQIKESFAQLLVLSAFNKILYKNYDEVSGKGYLGTQLDNGEIVREQNQIISNLSSGLLEEWYLTSQYLLLDEPMIDKKNKLLTEGRDDYSFKVAYDNIYNRQYQILSTTKQYNGSFIKEKEILKYLQLSVNDYFNKDYKGVGYERYYSHMQYNLNSVSEFLTERIKSKIFGKDSVGYSRQYPLEAYSSLLLCVSQDYLTKLGTDLKNKQLTYTKEIQRLQTELKTINEEYINSFGIIFSYSNKRQKSIGNFNDTLRKFWMYTIHLKGINFAIQLINSHLKSKLVEVKQDIDSKIKIISERRNKFDQEYNEQKARLNGRDEVKGIKSITNNDGLDQFQTALMKSKSTFDDVINRLESLIFENKDKIFQNPETLLNKDLPVLKQAYKEVDILLSQKNFRDLLNKDDQFYNAHVIDVLFNKYNKNAQDSELKNLLAEINNYSAPLAKVSTTAKGDMEVIDKKIIILPELQGITVENKAILDFYNELKDVIGKTIPEAQIVEVNEPKFKNEITMAQFLYPLRTDMIDNLEFLKTEYDELKKIPEMNFLMHIENAEDLVDLIPPKTIDEFINELLPYVLILNGAEGGFEYYGESDFWKIATGKNDPDFIKLETNSISGLLKLDFKILDKVNTVGAVRGFVSPFVYNTITSKAQSYVCKDNNSNIIERSQKEVSECLANAKNDTSNALYIRLKRAYQTLETICNN